MCACIFLTLGACTVDEAPSTAGGETTDAVADSSGAVGLAAVDSATIEIISPANFTQLTYTPGGNLVITVPKVTIASGKAIGTDYLIKYYLDGEEVAETGSTGSFSFTQVPFGQRHLAARLVTMGGQPLSSPGSLHGIYVRINQGCDTPDDCGDGLACSTESCKVPSGGLPTDPKECRYGFDGASGQPGSCCDTDLECPYDWLCLENSCKECTSNGMCDDGNPCTFDSCDPSNSCIHEAVPGCCQQNADCDDTDWCTTDSCDLGSNICTFNPVDNPLCCNQDSDCMPADPCVLYMCQTDFINNEAYCRFGPAATGCCTEASQCDDNNPCTLNLCEFPNPDDPKGSCIYEDDDSLSNCCTTHGDCEDGNPATKDTCQSNSCIHEENTLFCQLPPTSAVVINELMISPGDLPDVTAEWIELYNAGDQIVNLIGWTITAGDKTHEILKVNAVGGQASLVLYPGAYVILARSADDTKNGGFIPSYVYGAAISLPDPLETGAAVNYSVELHDTNGVVVDTVPVNSDLMPLKDAASVELFHPYADNGNPANWFPAGEHNDPVYNTTYGDGDNAGSPFGQNKSSYNGLPDPACIVPPGAHPCAEGRCGFDSNCIFPKTDGCCYDDVDCNDFDNCTLEICDPSIKKCLESEIDPLCCNADSECNDQNPCNLDRCIGSKCRFSPNVIANCCVIDADCDDVDVCTIDTCDTNTKICNPGLPVINPPGMGDCCNANDECDDADPATLNVCEASTNACIFPADPDYCTAANALCDDGNVCTVDACDVGPQTCIHTVQPGCCQKNTDCPDDGDACTLEVCNLDTGNCEYPEKLNCCLDTTDCDDGNPCTADQCAANNVCHNPPTEGCCNIATDCDDDTPCTTDSCVDAQCVHENATECCTIGGTPELLEVECGVDPDGPATCYQWQCTGAAQCELLVNDTCCTKNKDCSDGDACTTDFCHIDNTCQHVPQQGGGCCVTTDDCTVDDNNSCTANACVNGGCEDVGVPGCIPNVVPPFTPPVGDFSWNDCDAIVGAECSVTDSCWTNDFAGYLGPDEHAECFGWAGSVGAGTELVSPPFNPTGHYLGLVNDYVSVHFTLGFTANGSGGGMDDGTNDCYLSPADGDLVINEILADPGTTNDANGDGIANSNDDEFVEIVNVTDHAILLSNVTVDEEGGQSFTFPAGTCIHPGQSTVIFSKYSGNPVYRGALAFEKGNHWGFNNTGDTITVSWMNPAVGNSVAVDTVTYGGAANDDQSVTRSTPMDTNAAMIKHTATGYGSMSVGRCANEHLFPHCTPGGDHQVTVMITNKEGEWDSAEVLDVITLSGEMENRDFSYELSNFMTAQQQTWVGFRVESDKKANVDLSIDDFVVGEGHAPFFVDDLKVSKAYDPTTESVFEAPKVKAYLGETEVQVYWAHDFEWTTQDLEFEIISAPSYVSLVESKKMFLYGVFQTKLEFAPTANDHLGVGVVWLRVSDGVFSANLRIPVEVNMSSGYIVYEPPGFLGEVCDPVSGQCVVKGSTWADSLGATLELLGEAFQRTSDLSVIANWSEIKGVFVTTGEGAAALPLPQDANEILVDFVENDGGHIYWEGSHIMDFPAPSLQGYFRAMPTAMNIGSVGSVIGTSFLFPLTWGYTQPQGDVDGIAPEVGSEARLLMRDDSDSKHGLTVANEDGGTGSRTVLTTLLLSQYESLGGNTKDLIGAIINFWNLGYDSCNSADECFDGLACTEDLCVGGFCTNGPLADCSGCVNDLGCAAGEACTAAGLCVPIPGELVGSVNDTTPFACDSADKLVILKASATGFDTVEDVNVKVSLIMGPAPNGVEGSGGQTLGRTRITLRHGGKSIILRQPDDNPATHLHATYDVGALPAIGWLDSFNGQMVQGDWELTVEDTDGGATCNQIYTYELYVVKGPLKACGNSGDCDNGQYCDGAEQCSGGTCVGGSAPTFQGVTSAGSNMFVNACDEVVCDPTAKTGSGEWLVTGQAPSCDGIACSGGAQNVCGNGVNCNDDLCRAGVCAIDGACCNAWDDHCSDVASGVVACSRPAHPWYTDDDQCGYNDACVGGGGGAEGVCKVVCEGCTTKHSFELDKAIPDEGCTSEFFKISTGDLYTTNAFLSVDIDHNNVGQLKVSLFSPDDKKVVLYDGEAADQGAGCLEIQGLMMSEKTDNTVVTNAGAIELGNVSASGSAIGGQTSPEMSNFVIPFRLPHLKAGERIRKSHLSVFLETFVDSSGDDGIIPFKIDLYGLGYRPTNDVTVGDYFSGPSDPENTLIQKAFFVVETPNITPDGHVLTSDSANDKLVAYLNAQYDAGAKAGSFVFLRLNADSVSSPPGQHFWVATSSNGAAGEAATFGGDSSDGTVTDAGDIGGGASANIGEQTAPTVANYVVPFKISDFLGAEKEVTAALLRFNLEAVNDFLADGDMPFNVDLYGLPFRNSAAINAADFYQGALDLDAHLIQDNLLTVDTATGQVETSPAANEALMDYINTQLEMGAGPDDYFFLRFSPDDFDTTGNVGVLDDQWVVSTVESGSGPALEVTQQDNPSPKLYWTKGPDCQVSNLQLTYETSGPAATEQLCAFNGVVPDGTWKLQVCDTTPGSTGHLRSASLWVASADDNPASGQDCTDPIIIDANDGLYSYNGDNTCKADSTAGGCGGVGGHDTVYRFTFGQQKRIHATVVPKDSEGEIADWDTVVYVTQACSLGSDFCTDGGEVGFTETLDTLLDPGIYYLVIDGPGGAAAGRYSLDITFSTPGADGVACDEDLNCKSGYCANGFCCTNGDCCEKPASCPGSYSGEPVCDDDRECQGHRVDAVCANSICGSATVADDFACTDTTVSKDCGLLAPIYCNGLPNQLEPICPEDCLEDADCDVGTWCNALGQCKSLKSNGMSCGGDNQCESDECVDNVCCDGACEGLCEHCNLLGKKGLCSFVNVFQDPDDECEGDNFICGGTCDGVGACQYPVDTMACDTCTRCDGDGHCDAFNPGQTDPDNGCDNCQLCSGQGNFCLPATEGSDPKDDCPQQAAGTCGKDGTCNGGGACRLYVPGTECVAQSCTDGFRDPQHTCDGIGQCTNFDDVFCLGHSCEAGLECNFVCGNDGDCIDGYYCKLDAASAWEPNQQGACTPKKETGVSCGDINVDNTGSNECASNFCVNQTCCGSACTGGCRYCHDPFNQGSAGTCKDWAINTDPVPYCGGYFCDGNGACETECSAHSDCKSSHWCDGTECVPKFDNGGECSIADQCTSGNCNAEDGVCCDTSCESTCRACREDKTGVPSGTCTIVQDGFDPDEECEGGGSCGGACVQGTCNFPGTTKSCGTCKVCDGGGYCKAAAGDQDTHVECSDCSICNGGGGCKNVNPGIDPKSDCGADAPSTCGLTGFCDGDSSCDYYGLETTKSADSCDPGTNTYTFPEFCNGSGGSVVPETKDCAPFTCGTTQCRTFCTQQAHCTGGFYCDIGDADGDGDINECLPIRNDGSVCSGNLANWECKGGFCNNGYCCGADKPCCADTSSCSGFMEPSKCTTKGPGGCEGYRTDATCVNHICQLKVVLDPSACEAQVCNAGACEGPGNLFYVPGSTCDGEGSCVIDGVVSNCNDGNVCTTDSCSTVSGCSNPADNTWEEPCYDGPAGTMNVGSCKSGVRKCSGGGFTTCIGQSLPNIELCGGGDENCNGSTDEEMAFGCNWYRMDNDADESGVASDKKCLCVQGQVPGYTAFDAGLSDCNDSDADVYPDAVEICDGKDNNCKFGADEKGSEGCSDYFYDADGDGFGITGLNKCMCAASGPYKTTNYGDCNDINPAINPGAAEKCDGYDNNCDFGVDEGADAFCAANLGTHVVASECGGIGGCEITACDLSYFDADGTGDNGCEAREDDYDLNGQAETCTSAWDFGTINSGQKVADAFVGGTIQGNMLPAGDEDWYKVYLPDPYPYGKDFHFDVRFTENPGNKYVFDVYRGACNMQKPLCTNARFYDNYADFNYTSNNCSSGAPCGQQNCVGESSDDTGGAGGSCGTNGFCNGCGAGGQNCCNEAMGVGKGSDYYWVRVKAPGMVGDTYRLQISNDVY